MREFVMQRWMNRGGYDDKALRLGPDLNRGREIYFRLCSEKCHQPNAWGSADGQYPQIAGQYRTVQIKQLQDIRMKNRDNPTMFRFALPDQVGGEQALSDVSAYIASLPMNPDNMTGDGTDLDRGAAVYRDYCRFCHGAHAEGDERSYYPRIQGQNYQYMLRQFQWMREGVKRRNVHPLKLKQIKALEEKDILAVLDYVSRIKPPSVLLAAPGWVNPDQNSHGPNAIPAPAAPGQEDNLLGEGEGLL
ncbi:MAG: c-type cytochrome [Magnetococcales bacterium]|nr:c-type cytochrome [Magnetococcales bacterium]